MAEGMPKEDIGRKKQQKKITKDAKSTNNKKEKRNVCRIELIRTIQKE